MHIIDRSIVEQILTPQLCLKLSASAFSLVSRGKVKQTLRSVIPSDDGRLMGTMPAYITEGSFKGFGLKTVKVDFNYKNKFTSHEGYIFLYDSPNEGEMALVDAASVTELRTAAASALATSILTPKNVNQLAVLGTGIQAKMHVKMMQEIRPIKHIHIWGRNEKNVETFASWCHTQCNLPFTIAATPAEAVSKADIICTVTASQNVILQAEDLPENCHINAVGSSALGFQELAPNIYSIVELYVDSKEAVWDSSSCLIQAKQKGLIALDNLGTEIGELLTFSSRNEFKTPKRTLFKSVGLAVQDLVFAREIINQIHRPTHTSSI